MKKILITGQGIGQWIVTNQRHYKYQVIALTSEKAVISELPAKFDLTQMMSELVNAGFMYETLDEDTSVTIKIEKKKEDDIEYENLEKQMQVNEDKKIKILMENAIKEHKLTENELLFEIEKIKNPLQRQYFRNICNDIFKEKD